MTDVETDREEPPDGEPQREHARVLATWQGSPPAVKALVLGVLVQRLGAFIQVFLVLFLTARGFTPVQAGLVLGVYGAGSILGVLVGGALADRIGPRLTMVGSLVGTAPLLIAMLYLPHYSGLIVVAAVMGAVSQAFRPAATTMLSVLTPKHQMVMVFAMVRLATNVGTTTAPLIGAALVAVSYDLLFWAEAGMVLGYAAIVAAAVPARYPDAARDGADGEEEDGAAGGRRAGYREVAVDRRYLLFLVAVFINIAVYMQYVSTLPAAMRAEGLSEWWFGAVLSLNGLIVITCELLVTKWVQRWQMRIAVLVGFLLLGVGLAAYALPLGVAAFVVGTFIWSAAEVIGGPTILAYPVSISPQRLRGRYIGLISATFGVGTTVGPVAGLAAWELLGNQVWWWYAVVCGIGAAVAWLAMTRPAETPTSQAEPTEPSPERSS